MPRKPPTKTEGLTAYHDAHLDDADEWDEGTAEHVQPKPSGMTVFSLRLPTDEFRFLKRAADERGTTMSELTRTALRFYLLPRASGSFSAAVATPLVRGFSVITITPAWMGGIGEPSDLQVQRMSPSLDVAPALLTARTSR